MRGPLHIARPIQGWPVIVQAGASDAGRQLAAETAEMVFAGAGDINGGRAFYADIKGRMAKLGRDPDHLKILPGAFVVVGDSLDEAREKRARLDSLVHYDSAIASLSIALGTDASKFDPDAPLPEIPETNASKSGRERAIDLAKRENLTVRQLAQRLGGYGGPALLGTPAMIADQMEEWLETRRLRRLQHHVPLSPGGLDDFVDARRARVAAPRHLPPRVRGQDAAREPRPAAAGESLFPLTSRSTGTGVHTLTECRDSRKAGQPANVRARAGACKGRRSGEDERSERFVHARWAARKPCAVRIR